MTKKDVNLSVVMVIKDEEFHIGHCLERIKWADEIIILDNGSGDKTREIARKYTKDIFINKSQFNDLLYNKPIEKSKGKWILLVDADEYVTKGLAYEIQTQISTDKCDKKGYSIPFRNLFLGKWLKHGGCYPTYSLRLIRREYASVNKPVHTMFELQKKDVGFLTGHIIHFGEKSIEQRVEKTNRYTTLQVKQRNNQKRIPFLVLQLCLLPFLRFIKMYLLNMGFLDGVHGFIRAQLYMYTWAIVYMKEIEIESNKK